MLERLGFLRRVSKYPVVYQVTKATTRLLGQDSSTRRRHTLGTIQARLLGVHFYLEARAWPTEFIFKHEKKIAIFADAGCPPGTLPQRNGKPYLREHFVFWLPEGGIGIATVDQAGPGAFVRLRLFLRQFLPVLRSVQEQIDLFIVTADQQRRFAYEKLLRRSRAIHKLGLGNLAPRINPYCVRPPVPTIIEAIWPKTDKYDALADLADDSDDLSDGHSGLKVQQIIEAAPEPYKTMFTILAMTGMRAGEMLGLQWGDIDFTAACIHIRRSAWYGNVQTTKSKSSAAPVHLPESLAATLRTYRERWKANPQNFLFVTRNNRPPSSNKVVQYGVWPVLDALKIHRCALHASRHRHASLLLHTGATPKVVQEQSRHADPRVTLGMYSDVIDEDRRNAVERVAALLRPTADTSCAQLRPDAPKSGTQEEWIQ